MNINEKINARKQRWTEFLENKRRHLFLVHYNECGAPKHLFRRENRRELLEHTKREYAKVLSNLEWLDDDRVPCPNGIGVFTGTEIFAEAFGCKVHYPEDNMPFALPLVQTAAEAARLKTPDWSATPLHDLMEDVANLRAELGNGADYALKLPDMQTPMGISALIWEKIDFFPAMIEEPEAVKELSRKVKGFLFSFLDEWFKLFGESFIAHYPDYYMPRGVTVSEDEIGSVSPEMFYEFFLPDLVEMSQRYGGLGIHCCADSKRHWEAFTKIPNLKLLNFGARTFSMEEAYEFFAKHTAQYHCHYVSKDPDAAFSRLPQGARAVFDVVASTQDDALRLVEKMAGLCQR